MRIRSYSSAQWNPICQKGVGKADKHPSFWQQLLVGVIVLLVPIFMVAQKPGGGPATSAYTPEIDLSELTLDQTLAIPEVPAKQKDYIKDYMLREARALQKMGYAVETMRHGEVVIATIPASELFAPNDTLLRPTASKQLANFLPYFRTHGRFKVILAMHSDDTGSEEYLDHLTQSRIEALYGYFDANAAQTDMLQGYPVAAAEPLATNDTRQGRAQNRRLEIYIVPGPMLLIDAKNRKP